ncbi:MAG: hypothetical protein H6656_01260 [Ardenticatenaceae bacterium]|nr:hypothetical protein [Ardenticatenaceae bacterium]
MKQAELLGKARDMAATLYADRGGGFLATGIASGFGCFGWNDAGNGRTASTQSSPTNSNATSAVEKIPIVEEVPIETKAPLQKSR